MGEQDLKEEKPKRAKRLPEPVPMQYVAIYGLNYGPDGTRVEPGGDVPAEVVENAPWLLEHGHVTVKKEAAIG